MRSPRRPSIRRASPRRRASRRSKGPGSWPRPRRRRLTRWASAMPPAPRPPRAATVQSARPGLPSSIASAAALPCRGSAFVNVLPSTRSEGLRGSRPRVARVRSTRKSAGSCRVNPVPARSRRYSPGVVQAWRRKPSWKAEGLSKPASRATSSTRLPVPHRSRWAASTRARCRKPPGVSWKCRQKSAFSLVIPTPAARARAPLSASSPGSRRIRSASSRASSSSGSRSR